MSEKFTTAAGQFCTGALLNTANLYSPGEHATASVPEPFQTLHADFTARKSSENMTNITNKINQLGLIGKVCIKDCTFFDKCRIEVNAKGYLNKITELSKYLSKLAI